MEAPKGLNTWSVMMSELSQGRELAKQLQNHLDPCTPPETRKYLIEKILFTYNNLLDHISSLPCKTSFPFPLMDPSSQICFPEGTTSESPHSVSHNSDPETTRRTSKRRRTLPRWVKTVKVDTEEGGGVEGALNDGYKWRKYGQKIILGAAFPRGYYRCTHRYTRGCFATKQVQRSTKDSFDIVYKGHHTCSQPSHVVSQPSTSRNPPPIPDPTKPDPQVHETQNLLLQQTPLVVQTQLKVETESPDIVEDQDNIFLDYTLDELIIDPNFHFNDQDFFC